MNASVVTGRIASRPLEDGAAIGHALTARQLDLELLCGLVRSLSAGSGSLCELESGHPTGPALGQTVLEVEVDGERYVLVRTPRPSHCGMLSAREREIVGWVACGRPNKVIAEALGISAWTVSTHLRRIFCKLGVRSRAAMVAKVLHDFEESEVAAQAEDSARPRE